MSELTKSKELTHQQQKEKALFEGMSLVGIPKHLHVVDGEKNVGLQGMAPPAILDWGNNPVAPTSEGIGWNIGGGYKNKTLFLLMARASYLYKIRTRCLSLEQVIRWLDIYDDEEQRREMLHTYGAIFIKDFSDNTDRLISDREQFIVTRLIRHRLENKLATHVHYAGSLKGSTWWSQDLLAELDERNRTTAALEAS